MNVQQFISGLPAWDNAECLAHLDKDTCMEAEVTLPTPPGFTGRLVVLRVRRAYCARTELIVVDASRLLAA